VRDILQEVKLELSIQYNPLWFIFRIRIVSTLVVVFTTEKLIVLLGVDVIDDLAV